jgi:hypothetical protein
MDFGVWMSREVLREKLSLRRDRNSRAAWNLRRWPSGFVEGEQNRLFVASEGAWRGYFILADYGLINRNDASAPFTLFFDARTWTPIPPVPMRQFRGFTYDVPALEPAHSHELKAQADKSPASRSE